MASWRALAWTMGANHFGAMRDDHALALDPRDHRLLPHRQLDEQAAGCLETRAWLLHRLYRMGWRYRSGPDGWVRDGWSGKAGEGPGAQ